MTTVRLVSIGLLTGALGLAVPATAASYSVNGWQPLNSVPLYQYQVPGPLTGWVSDPIGVIADPFLSGNCFPASLQQTRTDAMNAEATGQALQLPPDYSTDDLSITNLPQYNLNTFAEQGPDTSTVRGLVSAISYQDFVCLQAAYRQVFYSDVSQNYSVLTPTLTVHRLPVGDQAVMTQATTLVPHLSTNPTGVISAGQLPGNQTTVPAAPVNTYIYAEDDVVRVRDGIAELSVFSVNHPLPDSERLALLHGLAQRLDAALGPAPTNSSTTSTNGQAGTTTTTPGTSAKSSVDLLGFILAIAGFLLLMFGLLVGASPVPGMAIAGLLLLGLGAILGGIGIADMVGELH